MQTYQEQIATLTSDLENQRSVNEVKADEQNRVFDAMKQLEADKAKVDDELAELKNKLEEIESENVNLHQVTLETNSVVEEKLQLASSVAQLQADNECLLKENEYYKTDLIPTMQEKSKEMQRKFREHEAQRKALLKENESMKNSENELL